MIKMKTNKITALLILLVISGCIDLNPGKDTTTPSNIYKGTKGLEISFVKNAPPSKVFEKSPFNVIVRVQNKGAYDVGYYGGEVSAEKGKLVITTESGYANVESIEFESDTQNGNNIEFSVPGKSLLNAEGDEIEIRSILNTKELTSLSRIHASQVFATVCYPYETRVSTSVCIDPDVLAPGEKACEVKELAFGSGQGAPVAVTKIDTHIIPKAGELDVQFVIEVQNKGGGELVSRDGYLNACGKETVERKIKIKDIKLSDVELDCGDEIMEKGFTLIDKKGSIKCSAKIEKSNSAYLAPLTFTLEYGYSSTVSKQFSIESY